MHLFPYPGLYCADAVVSYKHDGDTMGFSLPQSIHVWRIRLCGTACPEINRADEKIAGLAARDYANKILDQARTHRLYIPWPEDATNLADVFSFNRVPGFVYVTDDRTLNEMLIAAGHAKPDLREWPKFLPVPWGMKP